MIAIMKYNTNNPKKLHTIVCFKMATKIQKHMTQNKVNQISAIKKHNTNNPKNYMLCVSKWQQKFKDR